MYIKHLKVKNYRNFGDPSFEIELKPFTVILGENNIGKTNLLNALGLIFSQEIMIFRKRILEIDDINYDSIKTFKEQIKDFAIPPDKIEFPEVSVEVILTDMDEDQEAVVGDWFINEELTEVKITYLFAPSANFDKIEWIEKQRGVIKEKANSEEKLPILIDFPIDEYRYKIFGGNDPSNECNMYFLKMLKMELLDALRDTRKELIASGEYRLLYRILVQKDKAKYEDIKNILKELDNIVKKNPNLESIKVDVQKLLSKVSLQSTESENKIDFNFSSPEVHELLKKISMIYGTSPISVERNGLGRNNLLYISLILSHLSAHEVAGKTFFRLISIEEPEAHLHPHLQDHLAKNIEGIQEDSGKGMQLLLTTHSTHITAKIDLNKSVIIYNDITNKPNSHYILSGIDEKREEKSIHYLKKYIDATKSRMFFARKIILVEGISEQILIPVLFNIYSAKTLENMGCNVINVNGVAFKHFLKIIRSGFFIKGLVLTDSDTGQNSESRAHSLKEEFDQEGLIRVEISDKSTFEKDIIWANRKEGKGKKILLDVLKDTKTRRGDDYKNEIGEKDIDIESFYSEIKDYKAEFAFNMNTRLTNDSYTKEFNIPEYIKRGFEFLEKKGDTKS